MSRLATDPPKAICLFSGGLDSTTALWMALRDGYRPYALTVCYGQRHEKEVECARRMAAGLNIDHEILSVPLPWKGSALLDPSLRIPLGREMEQIPKDIPLTYVPARNIIFLALATSYAEAVGAGTIFIGANVLDYSGYPDCRAEFLSAFESAVNAGTKAGVEGRRFTIKAPLIHMTKQQIIEAGMKLGVPFEQTWSCYQGEDVPCGLCDSCRLRLRGFRDAGLNDPLMHHVESIGR